MVKRSKGQVPVEEMVDELLDLYGNLLVPFMKVRRDMPFPTENGRRETDSEHVFTVSVLAITVAERLDLKLDTGLIAKYALVHDLVEAYSGDVSVRDATAYAKKDKKEQDAFLEIKAKYKDISPWISEYIELYEARDDEESKLVYAVDKFMGALTRMTDGGKTWADYYPEVDGSGFHKVVGRLRNKAKAYPPTLHLFDAVHDELDKRWPGYLKAKNR